MLLPHRPPFLMVDSITSYRSGKNPSLKAKYTIKEKEPLYFTNNSDDHWPSVYIIEGLGQSCNLLIVIHILEKRIMEADQKISSMDDVFKRLIDNKTDELTGILKGILQKRQTETFSSIGFMGATDMEITGHATRRQTINYEVHLNQAFGSLFHLVAKAYTDHKLIAHGTMISARRKE